MYLVRLGRFPSPDPLIEVGQQYAELSPYQFAGLNPVRYIDLDGWEPANPPEKPSTNPMKPTLAKAPVLGQEGLFKGYALDKNGYPASDKDADIRTWEWHAPSQQWLDHGKVPEHTPSAFNKAARAVARALPGDVFSVTVQNVFTLEKVPGVGRNVALTFALSLEEKTLLESEYYYSTDWRATNSGGSSISFGSTYLVDKKDSKGNEQNWKDVVAGKFIGTEGSVPVYGKLSLGLGYSGGLKGDGTFNSHTFTIGLSLGKEYSGAVMKGETKRIPKYLRPSHYQRP